MADNALLFFLLLAALLVTRPVKAQGNTAADTSWTHEIRVGTESLTIDTLTFAAANVTVYDARLRQLPDLLQRAWPEALFRRGSDGYKATGAVVTALSADPLDVHMHGREEAENGALLLTIGFLHNGQPLDMASAEVRGFVHELGVRLNKAVTQEQIEGWRRQLGAADRKVENTDKVQQRTQEQLSDVSEKLEQNRQETAEAQKALAEARGEVQRYEERWSARSDVADLKQLSQATARLAKQQERLADLLDEQMDLTERKLSRSEQVPEAAQKSATVTDQRAQIAQIIAGLEHKRDSIR